MSPNPQVSRTITCCAMARGVTSPQSGHCLLHSCPALSARLHRRWEGGGRPWAVGQSAQGGKFIGSVPSPSLATLGGATQARVSPLMGPCGSSGVVVAQSPPQSRSWLQPGSHITFHPPLPRPSVADGERPDCLSVREVLICAAFCDTASTQIRQSIQVITFPGFPNSAPFSSRSFTAKRPK